MTRHDDHDLDPAAHELACLHALRALDGDDAAEYEAHVDECPACEAELAALEGVVAELGLTATPANPPEALLGRLLGRVRARGEGRSGSRIQPWQGWQGQDRAASFFAFGEESAWEAVDVPGVEVRRLFVDPEHDRTSMLIRMAPGASYPAHVHAGEEECYVIEGDLRVGEVVMQRGDYQFAAAGSEHPVQSTVGGCLLYLSSSLSDRLLA
jgi:quercetin dioxygenase-like cupin family protein